MQTGLFEHLAVQRGDRVLARLYPATRQLELVVDAEMAEQVVETITQTARTGKIGDGKIFVLDVAQAVRVRTGERNSDAI